MHPKKYEQSPIPRYVKASISIENVNIVYLTPSIYYIIIVWGFVNPSDLYMQHKRVYGLIMIQIGHIFQNCSGFCVRVLWVVWESQIVCPLGGGVGCAPPGSSNPSTTPCHLLPVGKEHSSQDIVTVIGRKLGPDIGVSSWYHWDMPMDTGIITGIWGISGARSVLVMHRWYGLVL